MLLCAVLAACKPTPTEDFVVNKSDGKLEDIIAAEPEPESDTVGFEADESTPGQTPLRPAQEAPEPVPVTEVQWTDSFSVNAAMDRLDIVIDANVQVPESGTAPVYRIGFAAPDAEETNRLLQIFFGDRQAYLASHEKTKSYYKAQMERYIAEKEKAAEAWERDEYDLLLGIANEKYAKAPDDPPLTVWDGSLDEKLDLMAENEDGSRRYMSASEVSIYYRNAPEDPDVDSPDVKRAVPENEAEQAAVEAGERFLNALGIDAEVASIQSTNDMIRSFGALHIEGYQVYFAPKYGGLPVTDLRTFHGFDGAADAAGGSNEPEYSIQYEQETIGMLVSSGGEVVRFRHMRPSRILKTENAAAKLLPFSEVQELFKKYIGKVMFLHKGEPLKLTVHTVRLTMRRYPVKDSQTELYLLPCWEFVAAVESGIPSIDATLETVCVLRINALDGSMMQ